MIFDKIFNINQQNGGALKPAALSDGGGLTNGGTLSNGTTTMDQAPPADDRLEITNVWSGPIIILSSDSQAELEKHYLSYSSTIPAESFEAIFRGNSLVET